MQTCQINYDPIATAMFMRLATLMDDKDLCLGPPVFHDETGIITQLVGMCPMASGGISTFKHLGKDQWHCSYDDGEDTATLPGTEIHKWFNGNYGESAGDDPMGDHHGRNE